MYGLHIATITPQDSKLLTSTEGSTPHHRSRTNNSRDRNSPLHDLQLRVQYWFSLRLPRGTNLASMKFRMLRLPSRLSYNLKAVSNSRFSRCSVFGSEASERQGGSDGRSVARICNASGYAYLCTVELAMGSSSVNERDQSPTHLPRSVPSSVNLLSPCNFGTPTAQMYSRSWVTGIDQSRANP